MSAKPLHRSLTLRGAAAMVVAYALTRLNLDLPAGALQSGAEIIVDLLFSLGAVAVGAGRARANGPLA